MLLPGPAYDEADNAFYERAIENYPDHSPALKRERRVCGPVRSGSKRQPAYKEKRVNEIVKQGRDQPRPLTYDETEVARKNRQAARGDLAAMEVWYRAEIKETRKSKKALEIERDRWKKDVVTGDDALRGVEMGDAFWMPVEW